LVWEEELSLRTVLAVLFAVGWGAGPLAGQVGALDAGDARPLRQLALSTWTSEQGLPQDFVTAIAQTPDGFLWVGTYGGLARFDGLHFKKISEPAALRSNIYSLAVDAKGRLWVGTPAGLFVSDDHGFVPIPWQGKTLSVREVLPRGSGGVWVWTQNALFHADSGKLETDALPVAPENVLDIADGGAGGCLIAGQDRVLLVAGNRTVAEYPLAGVRLLYRAPDGRVFAGDGHHLFLLDKSAFRRQAKSGSEEFVGLLVDRRERLWMASGGLEGITRLANGRIERLDKTGGLNSNDARVLFEDRDGDIWIGTIAGLQRLHAGAFTSFTASDGLAPGRNQFDAIFADRRGSIWAGTLDEGIARWDGVRWKVFGKREGVRAGQVRGFADAGEHPVFAMSDYGLFAWSRGKYRPLKGIPAGYVTAPLRARDGSLWFSVLRKGVFQLRNGKLTAYGAAEGMADKVVSSLKEESGGDLLAGGSSGVFRWRNGQWSHILPEVKGVVSIFTAPDGSLYLGTTAGLVFSGAGARQGVEWKLTQQDGLPGDSIFGIEQSSSGDLWLTTTGGISRIPHEQLEALNRGKSKTVTPEVYTLADGLKSRSVLPIGQVTVARGKDGRLWFAANYAPSVASVTASGQEAPQAIVDEVTVDERAAGAGPIHIAPGRRRVTIHFTAPSFVAPEQIRFRYKLNGWDAHWVEGDAEREASYAGLPPGDYSFEVEALGRTGIAGPKAVAVPLRVEPFFWQTAWFLALMGLLGVGIVVEVTRRRTQASAERMNLRFEERAMERERIASQIHDTFIQDLIGTALQLELVELQLKEDAEIAQRSLHSLASRLRGIIGRSREMISSLYSIAAPEGGLEEILRHLDAEFRLGDLPLYELSCEGEPVEIEPYVRDETYRICREAVANAFRHAGAAKVAVALRFAGDQLAIRIEDDGAGMSEETREQGRPGHFGLPGMRTHARRIGMELRVMSEIGRGTTVVLQLDLRRWRPGRLRKLVRETRRRLAG
jgi:signal transduction histidine kinase/ligand-binding sensor domain-containing protein